MPLSLRGRRVKRFLSQNCIDRIPAESVRLPGEDAAVGAGYQGVLSRLPQRKDVAAFQTRTHLLPVRAGIPRNIHTAMLFIIQQAGIEGAAITAVHQQRCYLAMAEALVGSREAVSSIITYQHASAIGGQYYSCRLAGINQLGVSHH